MLPVTVPTNNTQVNAPALTMGSMLQCIFRSCLEKNEDAQQEVEQEDQREPVRRSMDRANEEESDHCCRPPLTETIPWVKLWSHLCSKERYQHLATSDETSEPKSMNSPLRTASTFDSSSRDILTIHMEEFVLPGSALQSLMAQKMAESLQAWEGDDECVICMEGFSSENPRMPTLCGCGENKTFFHLPCLYQWMEQSDECPSCRHKITWEEF